jgi:hypothetical protein
LAVIEDEGLKIELGEIKGYYPIIDNKTGKEVGYFMCTNGNKLAVRFLSWMTDYRGKDAIKHTIKY